MGGNCLGTVCVCVGRMGIMWERGNRNMVEGEAKRTWGKVFVLCA